jgi:hypothetical protein
MVGFYPNVTAIHLRQRLRDALCNQPGRQLEAKSASLAEDVPSLFGLAPGGACHASPVAGPAVRSYRTFSPLPQREVPKGFVAKAVHSLWRYP